MFSVAWCPGVTQLNDPTGGQQSFYRITLKSAEGEGANIIRNPKGLPNSMKEKHKVLVCKSQYIVLFCCFVLILKAGDGVWLAQTFIPLLSLFLLQSSKCHVPITAFSSLFSFHLQPLECNPFYNSVLVHIKKGAGALQ